MHACPGNDERLRREMRERQPVFHYPDTQAQAEIDCISDAQLKMLTDVSRHIAEIANLPQSAHQPFVGRSAFTHKGGIHVSAVLKNASTYEHIKPEACRQRAEGDGFRALRHQQPGLQGKGLRRGHQERFAAGQSFIERAERT